MHIHRNSVQNKVISACTFIPKETRPCKNLNSYSFQNIPEQFDYSENAISTLL